MTREVILLILAFFLTTIQSVSQTYSANDTYPSGQLKFKGKFVVCSTHDKKYPMVEIFEKRKFGKWIAYNSNGTIKETRQYTKKGKDCETPILKKGEWKYYNQDGVPFLTELYINDTIVHSELDIYQKNTLIGKLIKPNLIFEMLDSTYLQATRNQIPNTSFDQYYFKPIQIENNGQDKIEELVPFWYSPDMATPDYYNNYRSVDGVPNHLTTVESKNRNGYIGLILYLDPKKERLDESFNYSNNQNLDYKESIQSKLYGALSKNRTYCFKASILLSRNAGFSINRFGVLLTKKPIYYNYWEFPTNPSFSFTKEMNNTDNWDILCRGFVAKGGETHITLSRFSPIESTKVSKQNPSQKSSLDINKSAYYLLDDLQLYEVNSISECGCIVTDPLIIKPHESIDSKDFGQVQELTGNRFVINNILFDFNKAEIKTSFIPELQKVQEYLLNNILVRVMIKGYTDNFGTEDYNDKLSSNRAKVIARWLIDNGINEERISFEGLGSSEPLVANISDTNRQINRRVEIEFLY